MSGIPYEEPRIRGHRMFPGYDQAPTIEQQAEQVLRRHAHFVARSGTLKFTHLPDLETLRVEGCLPTYYLKQMVQEALRKLPGISEIDNRIMVIGRAALISELDAARNQSLAGTN